MIEGNQRRSSTAWIRWIVLVVIGGWIVLSPAYRQVFGGKSTWFPRWVMFHGFGRDVCDVRFFESSGGELTPLDRFEVLGRERSWSTNKSLVRMDNSADVDAVARRLCKAMGPEADVRIFARCGSRGKWKVKRRVKENACRKSRRLLPKLRVQE